MNWNFRELPMFLKSCVVPAPGVDQARGQATGVCDVKRSLSNVAAGVAMAGALVLGGDADSIDFPWPNDRPVETVAQDETADREEADLDRLDGEEALRRLADPDQVPIPYREARKLLGLA